MTTDAGQAGSAPVTLLPRHLRGTPAQADARDLQGRNLVVFGDDWGRFPSTVQHLGKEFSRRNRVLWIGSLGHRRPRLRVQDVLRVAHKVRDRLSPVPASRPLPEGVVLHHPPVIPWHDLGVLRSVNARMLTTSLRRKLEELRMDRPVILTSSPLATWVVGRIGESSSHYLCLDDYALFAGAFRSLPHLESDLLKKVDSCLAVSRDLAERRRPRSGRTYILPQGVDTDHFSPDGPIHPLVQNLGRPVVGFFGLLADWVDLSLVEECARSYPRATFLVIGRQTPETPRLPSGANIVLLGELAYADLPSCARVIDVGLIPFVVNPLTVAANPLKLLEYLALGAAVVSTDLPEVRSFGDVVMVAKDRKEFVHYVGQALEQAGDKPARRMRRARAELFSWTSLAEEVSAVVRQSETERGG